jgi:pyruvate,water dikinase
VRARLARFDRAQAFSVRSSSTMEDLAGAAFAGQHDTFLNCTGEDEILRRIRDCYLSLWADRAIAYRAHQGFDHRQAAMAVVVQTMVQCEVAGVAFSVNPVSGDLSEIVIDANFGLGESVVSGEGEVDHWTVDKQTGAVREARIARKTHAVRSAEQGTRDVELTEAEGGRPALDATQLAELAALAAKVEASYRFPQDIEWGIERGRLHLLQARPITTIPPRWTRDESAERFPTVITPLTWDFVDAGFHRSLSHSLALMDFPPFQGKWFGLHGHYVYGNQNAVMLYAARNPLEVRSLDDLRARLPALRHEFRWVQELPILWSRDLDHYLLSIGELSHEPLEGQPIAAVWDYVNRVQALGADYFLPNIAISITHGSLYRFLHWLLAAALGKQAAAARFDALMAFCDTKTGAINRELVEMARAIRAQPELARLLTGETSRALVETRALDHFPPFSARFAKFLRDHGHREVEFDAYHATWLEAPWVVLDNLRLMLSGPLDRSAIDEEAELKRRMQEAELETYERLPKDLHYLFSEILRLARAYTSLDDVEHYQTTRLTLPLRRGLRELGTRLVRRGVVAEPLDVFFAHRKALDEAVACDDDAGWAELGRAVREEKAQYLRDRDRKPEWLLGVARDAAPADGNSLAGIPGSAGSAEGAVFLVLSSDDFARFPKGAVLVARTTNPTWTPLFYSAAAVITESGGPLSHGAVTAREMRIPAVMSVRDCLSRLANGTRVRVDGTQGRVQIL